jgi:D-alanyl-D-alanine carboxypeptidase
MRTCRFPAALVACAVTCFAQAKLPSTPAGKVMDEYLIAANSRDKTKLEAFQKTYAPDRPEFVERTLGIVEQSGGFDLSAIKESEPRRLSGMLKERKGENYVDFTFRVSDTDPPRFAGMRVVPGSAPITESVPFDRLLASVEEQAAKSGFQGAVLIAKDWKPVLRKAYGMADRTQNKPNTPETRFRIGSMNKMFTAVAVLQLVDKGRLDLDAPIAKYIPGYPNRRVAPQVKVRHLLNHTGGTGDIFTPEYERARRETRELKDYMNLFGQRGLEFDPGTKSAYSNYGFILLGNIIEAVSNMSYYDYVRRNILEPAGMTATGSQPESEPVSNRAVGYTAGGKPNTGMLPWRGTSAGGGYATVDDLLRFVSALESGRILSKTRLAEATANQAGNAGGPPYGFGFVLSGSGGNATYGHGGGAPGMNGELTVVRGSGIVVVVLSNTDPPAATELSRSFTARLSYASDGR